MLSNRRKLLQGLNRIAKANEIKILLCDSVPHGDGFALAEMRTVLVNREIKPRGMLPFALAHELGHIFCGRSERSANIWAFKVLSDLLI